MKRWVLGLLIFLMNSMALIVNGFIIDILNNANVINDKQSAILWACGTIFFSLNEVIMLEFADRTAK